MADAFAPGEIDLSSAYSNTAGAAPAQPAASPVGELTGILSELGAILQSNNMFSDFEPIPGYIAPQTDAESVLAPEALATLSEDEKRQISDYLRGKQDTVTARHSAYERANMLLKRIGFGGNLKDFMALDRVGLQNLATQWVARGGGGTSASGQGQGNGYGVGQGQGQGFGGGLGLGGGQPSEPPGGGAAGGGKIERGRVSFHNEPLSLSPADAQVAAAQAQLQAIQQQLAQGRQPKAGLPDQMSQRAPLPPTLVKQAAAAGMPPHTGEHVSGPKQPARTTASAPAVKPAATAVRPSGGERTASRPVTPPVKPAAPRISQPPTLVAKNRAIAQ